MSPYCSAHDEWLIMKLCMYVGTMMPTMWKMLVLTRSPNQIKTLFIALFCPSEDMSPYCWAHDEWLIMKLCMYVGYHDAKNVSNVGGDPVTQLNLKKIYIIILSVRRHVGILLGT